jgi:hypothetical protein
MFSPLFTTASVCVWGQKCTALAAAVSEEHNCSTVICRRKPAVYSVRVKLVVTCRKKRGERAIDVADVLQFA